MAVIVERFHDPRYARPRYRLRHDSRQMCLRDGYTQGSYRLKRDAELRADELNMGAACAQAKRDQRYTYESDRDFNNQPSRVAIYFCGKRVGTAPNMDMAYRFVCNHKAERVGEALPGLAPFEFGRWSAWQGTAHVLLSDSNAAYQLGYFATVDDAINWLFANDYRDAARALNRHAKDSK